MDKGEEQDNPTLFEIMKDDPDITYNEATKVQEDLRLKKEGVCITGALKRDLSKGKEDREVKPVSLTESQQKQEELEPIQHGMSTDAQRNVEIAELKDQVHKLKKEIKKLKYANPGQ